MLFLCSVVGQQPQAIVPYTGYNVSIPPDQPGNFNGLDSQFTTRTVFFRQYLELDRFAIGWNADGFSVAIVPMPSLGSSITITLMNVKEDVV